jgi:hypothetical protein
MTGGDELRDARGPARRGRPLGRRHALRHGLRQLLEAGQPVGSAHQQPCFAEPLLVEPEGVSGHLGARAASRVGVPSRCRRSSSCRSCMPLRGLMGTSGRRVLRLPAAWISMAAPRWISFAAPRWITLAAPRRVSLAAPGVDQVGQPVTVREIGGRVGGGLLIGRHRVKAAAPDEPAQERRAPP